MSGKKRRKLGGSRTPRGAARRRGVDVRRLKGVAPENQAGEWSSEMGQTRNQKRRRQRERRLERGP